jgi:hypothetical protein
MKRRRRRRKGKSRLNKDRRWRNENDEEDLKIQNRKYCEEFDSKVGFRCNSREHESV